MNVSVPKRQQGALRQAGCFAFGAVVIVNKYSATMLEFERSEARTPRQMLAEITEAVERWEREYGNGAPTTAAVDVTDDEPYDFMEMSRGFLNDEDGWARIDVVKCTVREVAGASMLFRRHARIKPFQGTNKDDARAQVEAFGSRDDVRLLAEGLETNQLPKEEPLTPELRDGTAEIYREPEDDEQ